MPRIPSRPTVAPATATPNQPSTALRVKAAPRIGSRRGQSRCLRPTLRPMSRRKRSLRRSIPSPPRRADETVYPEGENPYRIDYAVYNLRSKAVIKRLIEAAGSGVEVRVLVEADQISPERPWNTVDEQFEEAGLQVMRSDKNTSLAEREAATLVGIDSNHLMHLKARVLNWKNPETGQPEQAGAVGFDEPGRWCGATTRT